MRNVLTGCVLLVCACLARQALAAETSIEDCHRLGEVYLSVGERLFLGGIKGRAPDEIVKELIDGQPGVAPLITVVANDVITSKPEDSVQFAAYRGVECLRQAGIRATPAILLPCYRELKQAEFIFLLKSKGAPRDEVKGIVRAAAGLMKGAEAQKAVEVKRAESLVDGAYATSEDRLTFMRSRFAGCVAPS